ncbi:glycoside hydrolase family 15 protein [Candidatus Pacearchaeota archaeon]|nr:MAG: glycoside hydrolase family 15 protein [Candidatus Pacearchaeota archaeon]
MTRFFVLGNGNILVGLDGFNRIRDFYYPYVGQENHVNGNKHKIGIWIDGKFSWLDSGEWRLKRAYKKDTLVSEFRATHKHLQVELRMSDAVHHKKNLFLREVIVRNLSNEKRTARIFFNQHFHISEANIGDTVYFSPQLNAIINYKGKRYFLISGLCEGKGFSEYACGVADFAGLEGTYVDAEDGKLSKNPIEHGTVDSTIGFECELEPRGAQRVEYWIAVGQKFREVKELHEFVMENGLTNLIKETEVHWRKWVNKERLFFCNLGKQIAELFKRSVLIVRAHTDNRGAIIAASDSDMLYFKKDSYAYMWPRDGALVARSLDRVGHHTMTRRFFEFCARVASEDGYLLHKYRPDCSFGSSWHPWIVGNKPILPIQEDETALLLDAIWKHYSRYKDKEFAREMYESFVKKAADFMCKFREKKTGLPKPTYDLWEEKLGVHTFTCATVYAGLQAASKLAKEFGKASASARYKKVAEEVRRATIKHLYSPEDKVFVKGLVCNLSEGMKLKLDKTTDASTFYGLFEYKLLPLSDARLTRTIELAKHKLHCHSAVGGLSRYENDAYYRKRSDSVGNPWFISSLWLAEYYIAKANSAEELKPAEQIFEWVARYALETGVLSEQIDPDTGEPLSVAPLTWSHAGFVIAVVKYLEKLESLGMCKIK